MVNKLININKIKSSLVSATGQLLLSKKGPDEVLGQLLADVQHNRLYDDGKTFVDLVPKKRLASIHQEYMLAREDPEFELGEFVSRHFYELAPLRSVKTTKPDKERTISQHISHLWTKLERHNRRDKGSLIALPYKYIVPGGRFEEQFYWDSYFIMLGLANEGRWDIIEGMIKNFAYMLRKFGFIPTANRTYFLSRSQPPFFSHMIRLLARHKGDSVLVEYLPYMLREYQFWMKGRTKLNKQEHRAFARVVEMADGSLLNRYYDDKKTPRPESLVEDTTTAAQSVERDAERLYLHLRAGAESGWDFSSRWFIDENDIRTIHTADIVPIDLNSLLYQLETTIAETYRIIKQPLLERKFKKLSDKRKVAIDTYCWDEEAGFFVDYNFHHRSPTGRLSLAGVYPLFAKIASDSQAESVARVIERDFLKPGGLVTTLVDSSQQWDAPNGWAPLHHIVIEGLRNYGHIELADKIKQRWIKTNMKVYNSQYRLVEKYDVMNGGRLGGGGEYALQDGFGWTSGVLQALLSEA